MLGLGSQQRFHLYRHPTDMRKGFDALAGLVTTVMGNDPLNGDAYIFLNRRRNRLKLLLWEHGGFVLYYKRLEKGTFELPALQPESKSIQLSWDELVMLISGIELRSIKRRPRFQLPAAQQHAYPI
jgi:transposase